MINSLPQDLKLVTETLYDKCGLKLENLLLNAESKEYGACTFELNGKKILHRVSKITPTKTGQFVTIWKRNSEGVTTPFDASDAIDLVIITSRNGNNLGQFIFPMTVLADKGIITRNGIEGKRGIRVYPPWDVPTNKQAEKTQRWQTDFFLTVSPGESIDFDRIERLLLKK